MLECLLSYESNAIYDVEEWSTSTERKKLMGKLIVAMYVAMTLFFLGLAIYMDDKHQSAIDSQPSYEDTKWTKSNIE